MANVLSCVIAWLKTVGPRQALAILIAKKPMQNVAFDCPCSPIAWRRRVLSCIAIVLALCISCSRQSNSSGKSSSSVIKHKFEHDKDKDGHPDIRVETHTRDGMDIFVIFERKLQNGYWGATRSYSAAGKLLVLEEDKDGDHFFESMVVLNPDHTDIEVFLRSNDGSVVVGSPELKTAYRRLFDSVGNFWDEPPNPSDANAVETAIRETQEKVRAANKAIEQSQPPPSKQVESPPTR
jgi:hypothetical protein